jgi:ferredoxin-NADP reductase
VQILLHEGGPTLFGQFLAAEAVDELFVTLSPQIASRAARTNRPGIVQGVEFAPNSAPWYQLLSLKQKAGHLYLRHRFKRGGRTEMSTATSAHTVPLTRREAIAEGTMAFHFAKPADFQFRAGQSMDLTLLNPPETDAEGNTRAFSIASAPFDKDLTIATRMRDTAFKRMLRKASPGLQVKIDHPGGSFVLHHNSEKSAVFLAGGIGITPFLSIIRQAGHDKSPHHMYLFYSNRRPEDAAFLDLLSEATERNPNFHLIATMTEMDKSHREWKGETGFINKDMVTKHLPSLRGADLLPGRATRDGRGNAAHADRSRSGRG